MMFWRKKKAPKESEQPTDSIPLGCLRIAPTWDGNYCIERRTIYLPPYFSAFYIPPIRNIWEIVKDGFATREEAMERIRFMGCEGLIFNESNVGSSDEK